jgi:hypothetical protein
MCSRSVSWGGKSPDWDCHGVSQFSWWNFHENEVDLSSIDGGIVKEKKIQIFEPR